MGSERDFDQYMNELMAILQKIIANHPQVSKNPDSQAFKFPKNGSNVFIFNFFPLTEEAYDEFDEILDREEEGRTEDLKYEISSDDKLFLKKNGIRF